MQFITEQDLRTLFNKEPFTIYKLGNRKRLTPGARQFLLDRRVKFLQAHEQTMDLKKTEKAMNLKEKMLKLRMKSIESLFLLTAEELVHVDALVAEKVINLLKLFKGEGTVIDKRCPGINKDNLSSDLENCFEITDFHIQLNKGKEIILLHRLRCALREIEPFLLDLYQQEGKEMEFPIDVLAKVNQCINILSQIICSIFGGGKCQKGT